VKNLKTILYKGKYKLKVGLGIKIVVKQGNSFKSGEAREVSYTCRYTSGHLIPNSVMVID